MYVQEGQLMECTAVRNLKIETNSTCRKCKKSTHIVFEKPDWAAQSVNLLEMGQLVTRTPIGPQYVLYDCFLYFFSVSHFYSIDDASGRQIL
jgi:hypothetical protein